MALRLAKEIRLNDRCKADPLYWLTSHTKTRDDHWKEKCSEPYAKFPVKPYFPFLFELFQGSRRLFLPKSREMMLSWAVIGWLVHQCQWNPNLQTIVQSELATKSIDLVGGSGVPGYAKTLYEQQDPFLKRLHPLSKRIEDMPGNLFTWANNSSIRAVPSGANQVRQYHPAIFVMDEAAFMSEAQSSYDTAEPVSSQIIVVSSAGPSWFGMRCENIMDNWPEVE
jgi:hypothetical protein